MYCLSSRVSAAEGGGVLLWQRAAGQLGARGLGGRAALAAARGGRGGQGLPAVQHRPVRAYHRHPAEEAAADAGGHQHRAAGVLLAGGEPGQAMEPQRERQHGAGEQGRGGEDLSGLRRCLR